MTIRTIPLGSPMAALAAALHDESGLPERWTAQTFSELLALPGVRGLLAQADDEPAGMILWRIAADEAEILTICVLPEHRRQGLGRRLLDDATSFCRQGGASTLFLEVAADNAPALAFYMGRGFAQRGRRPGYYRTESGAVDAHILALDL